METAVEQRAACGGAVELYLWVLALDQALDLDLV